MKCATSAGLGIALAALALAAPVDVLAQPPPEPPDELRREVFRVDTEVVLLDVVARDKKGRTVRDLRAGEIEVYEDGVRQETGSFGPSRPAWSFWKASRSFSASARRPAWT